MTPDESAWWRDVFLAFIRRGVESGDALTQADNAFAELRKRREAGAFGAQRVAIPYQHSEVYPRLGPDPKAAQERAAERLPDDAFEALVRCEGTWHEAGRPHNTAETRFAQEARRARSAERALEARWLQEVMKRKQAERERDEADSILQEERPKQCRDTQNRIEALIRERDVAMKERDDVIGANARLVEIRVNLEAQLKEQEAELQYRADMLATERATVARLEATLHVSEPERGFALTARDDQRARAEAAESIERTLRERAETAEKELQITRENHAAAQRLWSADYEKLGGVEFLLKEALGALTAYGSALEVTLRTGRPAQGGEQRGNTLDIEAADYRADTVLAKAKAAGYGGES